MGRALLIATGIAALVALGAGCAQGDLKIRYPSSWGGAEAPPANIAPADPNSIADLRRENVQLKDRIAWLEDHIRKSDSEYKKKQRDVDEIKADIARFAAERDRYKRAAGN
ncbi:MAG: hypothetical protein ACE15C_16740 [Phycisphaerae bacterium]